jgi:hypothetical protein
MKQYNELIDSIDKLGNYLDARNMALDFANWLFKCPYIIGENGNGEVIGYRVKTGEQLSMEQLFNKWRKHETNNL